MLFPFPAYIHKLKHIPRWNLKHNIQSENVKEHSFDVAVIAHLIAELHNVLADDKIDTGKVAIYALYHDATEVLTGDLPTPVKYFNPEIADAYSTVEDKALEKLLCTLPKDLQDKFKTYLSYKNESNKTIASIVKCADLIAAYIKAENELQLGNRDFQAARDRLKSLLDKDDTPKAVTRFIKSYLPTYWMALEEFDINEQQ